MMWSISILLLLSSVCIAYSDAQKLKEADFRVGMLKVGDDFDLDSVTKEFSPPTQIETLFQTHRTPSPETSYVFHFDSIVIDVEHGAIRTIEFTSLRLSTHRSVRIGDSADEVRSAYGK